MEGYYDGMEDPTFYAARKLRPLKLERRAYRACSPSEQFEFSGSEGRRTPTADSNSLVRPSETMVGDEYGMEDFIDSSGLEDADMPDLSGKIATVSGSDLLYLKLATYHNHNHTLCHHAVSGQDHMQTLRLHRYLYGMRVRILHTAALVSTVNL